MIFLKMGPPYQGRHTPPEFQVGKIQSIFGTAEINLFFPEPPGWASLFGTLKPIQSQKFMAADLMPVLAAYQNFFLFFPLYVGFVPVSNLLAIFVSNGQC